MTKVKEITLYTLVGFVALILMTLLIVFPSYQKQMNEAKEKIKSESRLLETKFGVMEYAISGQGKPVLLIHGAGGGFDQGLWLGRICLQGDYQFIAPSKFGYLSSHTPEEYSAKLQAEQYRILLDYLGIDKVSIIGVSAGGPSSMQFANDFPERVDKLILLSAVSMPPHPDDKDPFFVKHYSNHPEIGFCLLGFYKSFQVANPESDWNTFR
jgi:pimeloyl-ACP methyl ester carboxylesterase